MIGYDRLGSNGRMGNQLFQYAALRGIAEHHGYDWCIPPEDTPNQSNYGMHEAFNIPEKNVGYINPNVTMQSIYSDQTIRMMNPGVKTVQETSYGFDKELFDNFEDNTNLDGYLQSYKYFENIREQLLEDLTFKDDILEPCKEFVSEYEKLIFLHVRRGDATRTEKHREMFPMPTWEFYEEALSHFDDDTYVFVTSDDVEWCQEQEFFADDRFLIRDTVELYDHKHRDGDGIHVQSCVPHTDMCLMSLCQGGILSRSTFSWWGAYLIKNPTQPIVAPKPFQYYKPAYGIESHTVDESFLIPDNWVTVSKGIRG